ncbi:Glyoxalase/bleomycin resistance protein/dioxygenase [Legionella lansingensis]|uniref:Glyoxalase/bleomycin resistance protein/dioxygenase n=1 Tax=Legionella lansingensis TaxID=45067 RepID=A0A0W0VY36_9GAMM|nr:VOC family protein [Legionella lansingensis]KTD25004.1 Glyoxalase/bleomycin resistance protein/dioxygenase [Legionella lansingensis]SNV48716.1 Glyoxalase/bleomycin resistance protein/dioxygenase [Legionella lansingensis]
MTIEFNHTIISAKDHKASAMFLAEILNLPVPTSYGPFFMVETNNGVSLDFIKDEGKISPQHYAFLVSEREFDSIFKRIQAKNLIYWADPGQTKVGEINHRDGGRGVYFEDPNGHLLELLTRPYGSGDKKN